MRHDHISSYEHPNTHPTPPLPKPKQFNLVKAIKTRNNRAQLIAIIQMDRMIPGDSGSKIYICCITYDRIRKAIELY